MLQTRGGLTLALRAPTWSSHKRRASEGRKYNAKVKAVALAVAKFPSRIRGALLHSLGDPRPFVSHCRQDFGSDMRGAPGDGLAIEELFVDVPYQRLVQFWNGLEKDSSSVGP